MFKKTTLSIFLIACSFLLSKAQDRSLPIDTTVVTQHSVTANGATFSYTAKTGTQPVWDE
ncbi:MAG: hypothetical protein ACI8VZ_000983, partial [Candidatus Paceibacteria bacterium]